MKRVHRRLFSAIALLLIVLGALTCAFAQITPSQDAYTNSSQPTTNFGTATTLGISNGSTIENTYILFDLSSIPSGYTGSNVAKATLKLYVNTVTTAGSFNVDYINGNWTEKNITYNVAPALGNTIVSSVPLAAPNAKGYVTIDVTPALQAWLNGSQANDGIALVANSPLVASFDSNENTSQSHPGELDVVFTSGGTITGVTTANGSGLTGGGNSGTLNLSLINTCSNNQVLQWNGSGWGCASVGTGTITGLTAGTDLLGGGNSGNVTLNLDTTKVPQLNAANTFRANQTVNGSLGVSGTATVAELFSQAASQGPLVLADNTSTTGTVSGVYGESDSNGSGAAGVVGYASSTTGSVYGVEGYTVSTSASAAGIAGYNYGTGTGAYGYSSGTSSAGVFGENDNSSTSAIGVEGKSANGYGIFALSSSGVGVYAYSNGNGSMGVYGEDDNGSTAMGVEGVSAGGYGVYGLSSGGSATAGVYGRNDGSLSSGVYGTSANGVGVYGLSTNYYGGFFSDFGGNGDGLYATTTTNWAGNFHGDLNVSGRIYAGAKDFKIDHPLDPANQYLYHASVESSEMKNIYDGMVALDAEGEATVELPAWFEALNGDFRYQLTAVGAPASGLYIAEEIRNHHFKIAGGRMGVKVSWQVTGVRQDAFAKAQPLQVEVEKAANERGYYIHPELYGAPEERQIEWGRHPEQMKQMKELEERQRTSPLRPQSPQPLQFTPRPLPRPTLPARPAAPGIHPVAPRTVK